MLQLPDSEDVSLVGLDVHVGTLGEVGDEPSLVLCRNSSQNETQLYSGGPN